MTLGCDDVTARILPAKQPRTLPVVLSGDEVVHLFAAISTLKHGTILGIVSGRPDLACMRAIRRVGPPDTTFFTFFSLFGPPGVISSSQSSIGKPFPAKQIGAETRPSQASKTRCGTSNPKFSYRFLADCSLSRGLRVVVSSRPVMRYAKEVIPPRGQSVRRRDLNGANGWLATLLHRVRTRHGMSLAIDDLSLCDGQRR